MTNAQKTIAKPTATKAPTKATKGAGKHTATQANAVAQPSIKFALVDYARPSSGSRLFAHTQAFLTLSGISAGKAYPSDKARKVIGSTAYKYHSHNGNFESTKEGLKLTVKGQAFFNARGPQDPELVAAFTEVMTTGKPNDKANVKVISSRIELK